MVRRDMDISSAHPKSQEASHLCAVLRSNRKGNTLRRGGNGRHGGARNGNVEAPWRVLHGEEKVSIQRRWETSCLALGVTKMRKTIAVETLEHLAYCNSDKLPQVIDDHGRRKHWVGIGWVDEGPATGDEDETEVVYPDN